MPSFLVEYGTDSCGSNYSEKSVGVHILNVSRD